MNDLHTGPQGPRGIQGEPGVRGEHQRGARGLQGEIGDQGVRGYEGPRGDIGPRGVRGPKGYASDRRVLIGLLIAMILWTGAIAVFSVGLSHVTKKVQTNVQHILALQRTEQRDIYGSCHRLNILRANDNRSHQADYRYFTLTTRLVTYSLKHPNPGSARLTHVQSMHASEYIKNLEQSAKAKTWIPLTNCVQAVYSPQTFHPPTAIPFYSKSAPRSALVLGKDN